MFGFEGLTPEEAAVELLGQIRFDCDERLDRIARYRRGKFRKPYAPKGLTAEDKDAMRRARQPWCNIPGKAVAQTLAVEGWRPADADGEGDALTESPEWRMWQRSKMDAKQAVVHRAGADYGQAFVLSELRDGEAHVRVLSAHYTSMLFEDVLSDSNALWALTVLSYPSQSRSGRAVPGRAVLWDRYKRYEVALDFVSGVHGVSVVSESVHGGNGHNPVTRFAASLDDDGRVEGEIEPLIDWQDSFSQALFNLLTVQKDSAFRTVYGTGLRDSFVMDELGRPVLDDDGMPMQVPVRMAPNTLLKASDPGSRFGVLEGSDQSGYISTLRMLLEQFAGLSQTPPSFLLGTMVNVGAEAMESAEKSFRRKLSLYQRMYGEAWERVLRVGMILEGQVETALMEHGEVVWTDFDHYNLVGQAQALGTFARELQVPPQGLWPLIPGVSAGMLDEWVRLADQRSDLMVESDYEPIDWTVSGAGVGSEELIL